MLFRRPRGRPLPPPSTPRTVVVMPTRRTDISKISRSEFICSLFFGSYEASLPFDLYSFFFFIPDGSLPSYLLGDIAGITSITTRYLELKEYFTDSLCTG